MCHLGTVNVLHKKRVGLRTVNRISAKRRILKRNKELNIMAIEYNRTSRWCLSERMGREDFNLIPEVDVYNFFPFI